MKVILYMAITPNGMIAKDDDSSGFITSTESVSYVSQVVKTGALVIGRKTYQVLSTQPEFEEFIKAGVKIVVLSRSVIELKNKNHKIASSPKEALQILANSEEVTVAGGGIASASFVKENLVDEIVLDIEPTLLGKGIPLFQGQDFEVNLKFISQNRLSDDEIQLRYKVLK